MILSRDQLYTALAVARVPTFGARLVGDRFATVSAEWVAQVWAAGVDALARNAPRLVMSRELGGGLPRVVPRYLLNGFCCRGHGLFIYAHGMTGFAQQAAESSAPLDHDALAFGFLHYTATPRADNLNRSGPHENLWFVDHSGAFQTFEPGDGEENELTPAEVESISLIFAQ